MNVAVAPQSSAAATGRRIRVMIVDDAVVVRGLFSRWVEAEPDLEVVASLRTGREAVDQIERADPDVVVLDVDMPELDGIAALPLLLEKKRDLVVIMASTLTRRNAEISLRALSLGAADYIPKPTSNREVAGSVSFRRDLIEKIRQLGAALEAPAAWPSRAPPCRWREGRAAAADRASPAMRRRIAADRAARDAGDAAARAADRRLDRRAAGAQRHRRADRRRARPRAGADHPAHAADLHHHPGRASRPRRQAPGARGAGRRGGQCRHHLSRARRQAHDGRAPRRHRRDRARRRPAGQFLQAGGRPAVFLRRRGLGPQGARRWCSPAWARTACAARRRSSPPAAASWRRTRRRAWSGACPGQVAHAGLCSAVLPLDEIAPPADAPVRGRHARDPAGFRLSAQAAARALRPGAVGREAISRRKPPAAGRAQARPRRRSPNWSASSRPPAPRRSPSKWSRR